MRLLPCFTRLRLGAAALAATGLMVTAGSALGQSFFQQFFGFSGQRPQPVYRFNPPPAPARSEDEQEVAGRRRVPAWRQTDDAQGGRKYRTMCVRLCDGYYFPISEATTHPSFQRDVNKCEASCGSEARLFYMPSGETNAEEMTDLTGQPYTELPHAFKYRKTLVSGCACKPMPWSEAARQQHRAYARAEAQQLGGAATAQVEVAQAEERAPASRYPLPPSLSGPGVAVISANGTVMLSEAAPAATRDDQLQSADAGEAVTEASEATIGAGGVRAAADAMPKPGLRARARLDRQKVTIINAAAPAGAGRVRRARMVHAGKAAGVVFGPFSSEPRRINYGN